MAREVGDGDGSPIVEDALKGRVMGPCGRRRGVAVGVEQDMWGVRPGKGGGHAA